MDTPTPAEPAIPPSSKTVPPRTESASRPWYKRIIPEKWFHKGPLIPVLRFEGTIGAVTPLRPGLSLSATAGAMEKAFTMKGAKAIAVQINSPGGSPVQSTLIFKRLRALAKENDLKVYVFAEDVAASGGYLIALAGDEIYAEESSIVGSIGVITASFGFHELINRLGIERRVITAGENKTTLDAFKPEKPEDVERIKSIQRDVHASFTDLVKQRRGARIEAHGDSLFTGEFWSGKRAAQLGLIDGVSDLRTRMREIYGEDARFKLVQAKTGWFRKKPHVGAGGGLAALGQLTGGLPQSLASDVISTLEARSLWSRFGF